MIFEEAETIAQRLFEVSRICLPVRNESTFVRPASQLKINKDSIVEFRLANKKIGDVREILTFVPILPFYLVCLKKFPTRIKNAPIRGMF